MKYKTIIFDNIFKVLSSKYMKISKILRNWYEINKRDLPWRKEKDPYRIWVSEVILQQTRVNQGIDYYYRFIEAFPDIHSLAESEIDEIFKVWQGLGYYSRARNMHTAAKTIVKDFNNDFPAEYKDIIKLSGVGPYIAAAVASQAFGHPYAAIDSNVIRVISRLFGVRGDVRSATVKKKIEEFAVLLLDTSDPGNHNQAMMEFGALLCTPIKPKCNICPLNLRCEAFADNMVHELPARYIKKASRKRYFYYYIIKSAGKIFIKKRFENDIWRTLYEFPLIETPMALNDSGIIERLTSVWEPDAKLLSVKKISPQIKHILSHQHIYARFVHVEFLGGIQKEKWIAINTEDYEKYAFPALIVNYVRKNGWD